MFEKFVKFKNNKFVEGVSSVFDVKKFSKLFNSGSYSSGGGKSLLR